MCLSNLIIPYFMNNYFANSRTLNFIKFNLVFHFWLQLLSILMTSSSTTLLIFASSPEIKLIFVVLICYSSPLWHMLTYYHPHPSISQMINSSTSRCFPSVICFPISIKRCQCGTSWQVLFQFHIHTLHSSFSAYISFIQQFI